MDWGHEDHLGSRQERLAQLATVVDARGGLALFDKNGETALTGKQPKAEHRACWDRLQKEEAASSRVSRL